MIDLVVSVLVCFFGVNRNRIAHEFWLNWSRDFLSFLATKLVVPLLSLTLISHSMRMPSTSLTTLSRRAGPSVATTQFPTTLYSLRSTRQLLSLDSARLKELSTLPEVVTGLSPASSHNSRVSKPENSVGLNQAVSSFSSSDLTSTSSKISSGNNAVNCPLHVAPHSSTSARSRTMPSRALSRTSLRLQKSSTTILIPSGDLSPRRQFLRQIHSGLLPQERTPISANSTHAPFQLNSAMSGTITLPGNMHRVTDGPVDKKHDVERPSVASKSAPYVDELNTLLRHPTLYDPVLVPRFPIVLCHGSSHLLLSDSCD